MKIAIPAEKADLKAKVGDRLGTSKYLLIIDLETLCFEAAPNPGVSMQDGGGMQAVVLAISKGVKAVLTGYCGPTAEKYLSINGIEVLPGVSGIVAEVVEQYRKGDLPKNMEVIQKPTPKGDKIDKLTLYQALRASSNQFMNLMPIMVGVVLVLGLFNAFVSKDLLASLFSGNRALDTLWGACFGSIFAGNPINSYVIGGELMNYGVSLFAVTALIAAWASVGLVQLPAEIGALGSRFALLRNALSFALCLMIAFATVVVLNLLR